MSLLNQRVIDVASQQREFQTHTVETNVGNQNAAIGSDGFPPERRGKTHPMVPFF